MSHFPNTRREVFLTFCKVFQTEDCATFSQIKLDYLPEKHFKLTLKCVENSQIVNIYIGFRRRVNKGDCFHPVSISSLV